MSEFQTDVEQLMLSIPEVFIYKVPPLRSASGHRAEEWDLANPLTTGCCRIYQTEKQLRVALYTLIDSTSANRTDDNIKLFGECLVPNTISSASMSTSITKYIDGVVDSSRYYVLRLTNKQGQVAMIGIGFRDREMSFDFKTVINEFIKYTNRNNALIESSRSSGVTETVTTEIQLPVPDSWAEEEEEGEKNEGELSSSPLAEGYAGMTTSGSSNSVTGTGTGAATAGTSRTDLSLKEGQTIRIKIGTKGSGSGRSGSGSGNSGGSGNSLGGIRLLPKPPASTAVITAPTVHVSVSTAAPNIASKPVSDADADDDDDFCDFVSA